VTPAVGNDKSFQGVFNKVDTLYLSDAPKLKPVAKPAERGVGDWAKEDYNKQSKRTVMTSQTPEGEIGSIYLTDGRIRTTHPTGPKASKHGETIQFNVNHAKARDEYDKLRYKGSIPFNQKYNEWLANRLKDAGRFSTPSWAKRIKSPKTAHDLAKKGAPSEDVRLFEVFFKVNGDIETWHPSRGTGVKYETGQQTLAVLEAGLKHLETEKITDYAERNHAFYNFVKSRLPNSEIVKALRDPKTITVKPPKVKKTT
jgi:hypothetical protein